MFESLTLDKQRSRGIAQPMLSFAIHAGLIALAVSQVPEPARNRVTPDPIFDPLVIPDRDAGRTTRKVEGERGSPLPRPICECEIPTPGLIPLNPAPGSVDQIDHRGFVPDSRPSILDSAHSGVSGVYLEGDLTDSPVLVHFPEPVYPPALKAAGMEGQVQVAYVVDSGGGVEPGSIVIVSSDHPLMTESVRVSLQAARFRPGKVRGIAVRTLVRQTIRFSLMSL